MTKTLYVPDHVATFPPKLNTLEEVYTKIDKEIPRESLLDKSTLERLPVPTGWRILILPYRGQGKTKSGVFLPDESVDREAVATVCGYVLKIGPLAYADEEKFGIDAKPWCEEGDWVIFGRYAGSRFKIEGGEVRLLNDDEILAKIGSPEDILHT
jgi:chaperonin GroES